MATKVLAAGTTGSVQQPSPDNRFHLSGGLEEDTALALEEGVTVLVFYSSCNGQPAVYE